MKEYIKNNWTPLVVGFAVAMIYNVLLKLIESIILKIALIIAG
jgi:inner membrane protein involved in colicin E2 resistance